MMTALAVLGLAWFAIGTVLTCGTLDELIANSPARQAWRREHMDRLHADALADFFRSGLGFLWVFAVVMIGWPYFLWETLWESRRENQRTTMVQGEGEPHVSSLKDNE